jgi:hypothetical protein
MIRLCPDTRHAPDAEADARLTQREKLAANDKAVSASQTYRKTVKAAYDSAVAAKRKLAAPPKPPAPPKSPAPLKPVTPTAPPWRLSSVLPHTTIARSAAGSTSTHPREECSSTGSMSHVVIICMRSCSRYYALTSIAPEPSRDRTRAIACYGGAPQASSFRMLVVSFQPRSLEPR